MAAVIGKKAQPFVPFVIEILGPFHSLHQHYLEGITFLNPTLTQVTFQCSFSVCSLLCHFLVSDQREVWGEEHTLGTTEVPIQVQRLGGTLRMARCLTTPLTGLPESRLAAVAGAVGASGKKSYTMHLCKHTKS